MFFPHHRHHFLNSNNAQYFGLVNYKYKSLSAFPEHNQQTTTSMQVLTSDLQEILTTVMPRVHKDSIKKIASELSQDCSRGSVLAKLPSFMRQRTSRKFEARMIRKGLWESKQAAPNCLSTEIDQTFKNVLSQPNHCVEKLLSQLKLRLLLNLHPEIQRADLSLEVKHIDAKGQLKKLEEMIQAENNYTNAIYRHFEGARAAQTDAALLDELKKIEAKLYHINISELKRLKNEAEDARRAVEGKELILLMGAALLDGLVGRPSQPPSPKQQASESTSSRPRSHQSISSASSSSSPTTVPTACLGLLSLWDQPSTMAGVLPVVEETSPVELQLSQKFLLQAVRSASKVSLVVPIQKRLEETVGKDYLLSMATRVAALIKDYEKEKASIWFVFEAYNEEEIELLRKRIKATLEVNHANANVSEVLKHVLAVTSIDAATPYYRSKDLSCDLDRRALLNEVCSSPGVSANCLTYTHSRTAQAAAIDYCSHLFSLCFVHKDGGLVKYLIRNIEFVASIVENDKLNSILANVQAAMKKRLNKKVILGIDSTSSIPQESQDMIRSIIKEVFERVQEILDVRGLPRDYLQVKVIVYRNYSSGKQNLKQESAFTSDPTQLSEFIKSIERCGGHGHEAIEVLYHQVREEPQTDELIIFTDARPNSPEETRRNREEKGRDYWKGTEFEDEWDAELECREVMARGIPISCLYVGDQDDNDSARHYFENVCRESGGVFSQFKNNSRGEMVEALLRMLTAAL